MRLYAELSANNAELEEDLRGLRGASATTRSSGSAFTEARSTTSWQSRNEVAKPR